MRFSLLFILALWLILMIQESAS